MKFILYLFSILATCGEGEYKCENSGICIGIDKICDGTVDCPDNEEDEWTCTEEPSKCLGPAKVCDGIKDCDNNEDEDAQDCCKHSKGPYIKDVSSNFSFLTPPTYPPLSPIFT